MRAHESRLPLPEDNQSPEGADIRYLADALHSAIVYGMTYIGDCIAGKVEQEDEEPVRSSKGHL